MPKRQIYLQQSDNICQRTRQDLEFLRNYWDRLLALNRINTRLPELLYPNHLMRQLPYQSSPSNGLRVNVSFTIFDNSDCLEPEDINTETHQLCNAPFYYTDMSHNGRSYRSPRNSNMSRSNNLLESYIRQMSENYAAIERELIRARVIAPLIERNRIAGCQSAFYNQRTATNNLNRSSIGNQASYAKVSSGLQERYVNSREKNDHKTCAAFRHECCIANTTNEAAKKARLINQQPERQKDSSLEGHNDSPKMSTSQCPTNQYCAQDSPQSSFSCKMFKKLQSHYNVLQNSGTPLNGTDNAIKWNSKELVEECQNINKINAAETSRSIGSHVKSDGAAINRDKRSMDSQPICQEGIQQLGSTIVTDQSRQVEGEGFSKKYKLNDSEGRKETIDLDSTNRSREIGRIKPQIKITSTTPALHENTSRTIRSRIRNSRLTEGRQSSRRYMSTPKYASFLRMCRKEETDEQLGSNSTSRKDEAEKLQRRRGIPMESSSVGYGNRVIHNGPQIERRNRPIPRSTVHTTYNPMMQSSVSDPVLDSSSLTIQLLRLAVLLYAPALMPALNSLIAQQNHQTPVSIPCFEGSNDLLTHIFRLLNEQRTIPNLSFVSVAENLSSTVAAESSAGSSSQRRSEEKGDTAIASEEPSSSKQGTVSAGGSSWKSGTSVQKKNEEDNKWRLTSMIGSGVRLDRNIFKAENFRKFEEFLKAERNQENVQTLSTRSRNEVVMKEYFRDWLHRLLQQLDVQGATSDNSSSNAEGTTYPKESLNVTDETHLRGMEAQRNLVSDESLDSSKDAESTEHEEEDSDDQKTLTSTMSSSSSKSV